LSKVYYDDHKREVTEQGDYKYVLCHSGGSSAKFGPCEVCGKYVSDVFHQLEERKYKGGYTKDGCVSPFGHEACLRKQRRE